MHCIANAATYLNAFAPYTDAFPHSATIAHAHADGYRYNAHDHIHTDQHANQYTYVYVYADGYRYNAQDHLHANGDL